MTTADGQKRRRSPALFMALLTGLGLNLAACIGSPAGQATATQAAEIANRTATGSRVGPHSLLTLAEASATSGDHAAAVPLFRRAYAQDSLAQAPLVGLGRSLAALGQYEEAEAVFRYAVAADRDNPAGLTGLGLTLIAMDQPALALPFLDRALAVAPADLEALTGKALAADLTGDHPAALATYGQGLAIAPAHAQLRNNYGLSLALHGAAAEGVRVLEDALRTPASDGSGAGAGAILRQNLALAYLLAGNEATAVRLLAVDLDPDAARRQLAAFRLLKAEAPVARLHALTYGGRAPKQTLDRPANRASVADPATAQQSALRIVGAATAAPTVQVPAHQVPIEQADADLSDIPLLGREGWALQLAAYRKASELKAGWQQLKAKYGDLIGHLPPRRTEIDFGRRTGKQIGTPSGFYYRLNAGPLTSRAAATALCADLRARGAVCWVRPPAAGEATARPDALAVP